MSLIKSLLSQSIFIHRHKIATFTVSAENFKAVVDDELKPFGEFTDRCMPPIMMAIHDYTLVRSENKAIEIEVAEKSDGKYRVEINGCKFKNLN
jgi:hypothetical protein